MAKGKQPVCIFKCYLEEWERNLLRDSGDVAAARFVEKYKNIQFGDGPDKYVAHAKRMYYISKGPLADRGWTVLACKPNYEEGDERTSELAVDYAERSDTWDAWPIEEDSLIYGLISKWYEENPDPSIKVVMQGDHYSPPSDCISSDMEDDGSLP